MLTFLWWTVIRALFTDPQILLFSNFFIKNRCSSTIHTFKKYFITVFSISVKISSIQTNPKCPFVEPNDHTTICGVTRHCCGPCGNNGSKIVDQWWMMTLNLAETWPTYVIVVLIGVFFFSFSQLFLKIFLVYNLYCKNKIFTL